MPLSKSRRRLVERLHRRRTRLRERAFLAEGVRCVGEIHAAGLRARFAVTAPRLGDTEAGRQLEATLREAGIEIAAVDDAELATLAATESPQGVIAVHDQPAGEPQARGRILVADAIQDPGNLGTLIRSAAAFAFDAVWVLDGSVDPYNPKVVRASAGAIARLPVVHAAWTDLEPLLDTASLPLVVAAGAGSRPPAPAPASCALVIGNEGAGVRDAIAARADALVAIAMPGGLDSLNAGVAGSILMYALTQHTEQPDGK